MKKAISRILKTMTIIWTITAIAAVFTCGVAMGINPDAPPSLSTVPVPEPPNLMDYVKDKKTAIELGKALFWDMQVGSDGIQACASCHFHAGADPRAKNQLNPGLLGGDVNFDFGGPNYTLKPSNFPFHKLADPDENTSTVIFDTNDVASSQGVFLTEFKGIKIGSSKDKGKSLYDEIFHVGPKSVRRVEPRNTPSVINAAFNFANFWDGRANNIFNGVNPFGAADQSAVILVNNGTTLEQQKVRISNASLASQAVGPPLSDFEMSFRGRTFPDVGRKMLALRPLGKQLVHPCDSVLGLLSRATYKNGKVSGDHGLKTSYSNMIKKAFRDEFWNSKNKIATITSVPFHEPDLRDPRRFPIGSGKIKVMDTPSRALWNNEYTQMEANFSLFFGLAVQLYEATLIADNTPFDQYQEGKENALTDLQKEGLEIFLNQGRCINCHGGSELTNASVRNTMGGAQPGELPENAIEKMLMASGEAIYDNGFYNISVRKTQDDIGRGGTDPFGFPLSFSRLGELKAQDLLPPGLAEFVPNLPTGVPPDFRVAVDGAFKTPGLRGVELTGPYFHNGGDGTLRQVVDFYTRGGNFPENNIDNLDPDIEPIGHLKGHPERKNALVDFLLALTDERVRQEIAPFDHPELFVPNGELGNDKKVKGRCDRYKQLGFSQCDEILRIPPVGCGGRPAANLPPLKSFLNMSPFQL